jgi:hypothetical protein
MMSPDSVLLAEPRECGRPLEGLWEDAENIGKPLSPCRTALMKVIGLKQHNARINDATVCPLWRAVCETTFVAFQQ